jgi:guanylate kinase
MSELLSAFIPEQRRLPIHPTLFLCMGVSGAGLTTAMAKAKALGLAQEPAAQYTSRPLRPSETWGVEYNSVPRAVLSKIPQQVAISQELYGNQYGYFKPAIRLIQKCLAKDNVILDTVQHKPDWEELLGNEANIVSIFFAPNHPVIALHRMIARAERSGARLSVEEVKTRVAGSRERLKDIDKYDYWLDTTDLDMIFPALTSIIQHHSFGAHSMPHAIPVSSEPHHIERLIRQYNTNLNPYIEAVL